MVLAASAAREDLNAGVSDEDEDIGVDLTGADLLKRELGASVLREDSHG